MSDIRKKLDLAAARARLDGRARARVLAQPGGPGRNTEGFEELLDREFPRQAIGWRDDEDPRGPPQLPEADGRVAGAGRA